MPICWTDVRFSSWLARALHSHFWAGSHTRIIVSGSSREGSVFLKDNVGVDLLPFLCHRLAEVHRLESSLNVKLARRTLVTGDDKFASLVERG